LKKNIFLIFILLISSKSYAGTFNTNSGAFFSSNKVAVRVVSNTDCTNAGTSVEEIRDMIGPAIDDYWNTVTTSRLKLTNGGIFETEDTLYQTGELCTFGLPDSNCPATAIPPVSEILITCNDNTAVNFEGTEAQTVFAIALPNDISGNNIIGSIIIINNTPDGDSENPFSGLSYQQKIAVISHEIGHAIGIGHTSKNENIMYYTPTPERFALGADDAMAMSYLYPEKFDGCGLFTTKDSESNSSQNPMVFLLTLMLGLSLGFLVIVFKKFFFKL
jgi:hypothetical protein